MRWILEHFQLIIVIAGAIAWWLNQRAREKAGQETDYDEDGTPETRAGEKSFEDPELAERTRQIREEIQRKIEERRRAGTGYTEPERPMAAPAEARPAPYPTPPIQPPLVVGSERPVALEPPPIVREVVVAQAVTASLVEARRRAEILEQQAALAEQLAEAKKMQEAATRRLAYETAARSTTRNAPRERLQSDLKGADNLRRAFVLREVLGPPVGLR